MLMRFTDFAANLLLFQKFAAMFDREPFLVSVCKLYKSVNKDLRDLVNIFICQNGDVGLKNPLNTI